MRCVESDDHGRALAWLLHAGTVDTVRMERTPLGVFGDGWRVQRLRQVASSACAAQLACLTNMDAGTWRTLARLLHARSTQTHDAALSFMSV